MTTRSRIALASELHNLAVARLVSLPSHTRFADAEFLRLSAQRDAVLRGEPCEFSDVETLVMASAKI